MAYLSISEIQAKIQHVPLTTASDPSESEALQMRDEVEAQMDARMNAVGIDVPITDTDKLNVVKPISGNGTVAAILRSIDMASESAIILQRLFDDAMKVIEKNPNMLETAQSFSAPGSEERGTIPFKRDTLEW